MCATAKDELDARTRLLRWSACHSLREHALAPVHRFVVQIADTLARMKNSKFVLELRCRIDRHASARADNGAVPPSPIGHGLPKVAQGQRTQQRQSFADEIAAIVKHDPASPVTAGAQLLRNLRLRKDDFERRCRRLSDMPVSVRRCPGSQDAHSEQERNRPCGQASNLGNHCGPPFQSIKGSAPSQAGSSRSDASAHMHVHSKVHRDWKRSRAVQSGATSPTVRGAEELQRRDARSPRLKVEQWCSVHEHQGDDVMTNQSQPTNPNQPGTQPGQPGQQEQDNPDRQQPGQGNPQPPATARSRPEQLAGSLQSTSSRHPGGFFFARVESSAGGCLMCRNGDAPGDLWRGRKERTTRPTSMGRPSCIRPGFPASGLVFAPSFMVRG